MAKLVNIDLIKELELEKLPKEQQEKILEQVGEVINQRVTIRFVEELSDEDKEEFFQILQASEGSPENVQLFLKEKVPNLDELAMEEINEYKKELVEFIDQIK